MRLWSLHPRALDRQGLVAVWREALLAQRVLAGATRGYRHHPQLRRFQGHPRPGSAIAAYLHAIADEADRRGYRFDRTRITAPERTAAPLPVTAGQLRFEAEHLAAKLRERAPERVRRDGAADPPEPHPLFRSVPGPVASWERVPGPRGPDRPPQAGSSRRPMRVQSQGTRRTERSSR